MPALPFGVLHLARDAVLDALRRSEVWRRGYERRQDGQDQTGGGLGLSGTAVGFLVPLIVFFILGPFICIYVVRKRRNVRALAVAAATIQPVQLPVIKREDARKRLESVTSVAVLGRASVDGGRKSVENGSMMEKECAICLSTLHAPSPPEPAKVIAETTVTPEVEAEAVTKAPSIAHVEAIKNEEILRLTVCGHEFHAECLLSWFMVRRYDCPICRAVYYNKTELRRESRSAQEMAQSRSEPEPGRVAENAV